MDGQGRPGTGQRREKKKKGISSHGFSYQPTCRSEKIMMASASSCSTSQDSTGHSDFGACATTGLATQGHTIFLAARRGSLQRLGSNVTMLRLLSALPPAVTCGTAFVRPFSALPPLTFQLNNIRDNKGALKPVRRCCAVLLRVACVADSRQKWGTTQFCLPRHAVACATNACCWRSSSCACQPPVLSCVSLRCGCLTLS
jgi:hypothetical protein